MSELANPGLLDGLFTTEDMRAIFSDRATVQGMLDFEVALARAEGALGVIPSDAVAPIVAAARAENYNVTDLALATAHVGNPAIPLIKALTARVAERDPNAAQWVHWGATSQDAIDSGRMVQLQQAVQALSPDIVRLKASLARRADQHRRTLMPGRTLLQHAAPISFGLKIAGWLDGVIRSEQRLLDISTRALALQLGGAVGNFAVLGCRGLEIAAHMASALQLAMPDLPWHTQRDRIVEFGGALALMIGALGKIARDISLLMQSEIAEVAEPFERDRGGSSTLPHKHNPVGSTVAIAAALRAPGIMAGLYSVLAQEHERAVGGWHAEWELLPELCRLAAGSLAHLVTIIEGLQVDTATMHAHVMDAPGVMFAEAVAIALADKIGRQAAQDLSARLADEAVRSNQHLRTLVLVEPSIRAHLSANDIERLFDANLALGASDQLIDRVLSRVGVTS